MLLALLCAALSLCVLARADDWNLGQRDDWNEEHWVSEYANEYYYHAAENCRLARYSGALKRVGSDALAEDYGRLCPCPVCCGVEDPKADADAVIEAYERGGTLVIRIPDARIRGQMFGASEPARVPEALLRENENQLDDIARLVHGQDYCRWLENAVPGAEQVVEAGIPDLDADRTDALLMARRHIGTAWVLVVRPNEAITEEYTLPVIFYRADLRIATYDAGSTLRQGDGSTRWAGELALAVKKSGGEIAFRDEENWTDLQTYVVRDGDVNVAVFRRSEIDAGGVSSRFAYCCQQTWLTGYRDGEDVVYICPLSGGEVAALNDLNGFSLNSEARDSDLLSADETFWEADHEPVTTVTLPDGTVAQMDQSAYPVGTGFVSFTLARSRGGIAYYSNEIGLARSRNERWVSKGGFIKAYADGDPERAHSGYFCDRVTLVVPLEEVGALEPGLYRLSLDGFEREAEHWLEFRVTEGAPKPTMAEKRAFGGEGLTVAPHTPPHMDAGTYNSCTDVTRACEGGSRTRLLAGDTVFDLRGVDESWGWGVCSSYSLFAYPEGHPEQARQILANFDHSEVTMFDLGDGLLLSDDAGGLWRCDYDGGNLEALGRCAEDGAYIGDLLPVGDGVYYEYGDCIYFASLADFQPKLVYRAKDGIRNSGTGTGYMVYADGWLIVADGGILALDARLLERGGALHLNWLTDEYDPDSGANGYGYIALGGRLYTWSDKRQAMISMNLDGTDIREVSKERYWFHSVTPGGVVLALWGSKGGMFGDERTDAALFFPIDAEHPTFDPEHCERRTVEPECYDFVMGDWLYHRDAKENETRQPLAEVWPE